MAFYRGPRIVTNGLVLALDAANTKSYVSGSTTWFDVSGNNNNATMFGTVPFLTDASQCFDFATATGAGASSSTLGFTFASNMISTIGNFTLSTWVKNPNTNVGQVGLFSNAGSGDGYRFGVGKDGIYYLIGPTYTEGSLSFSSTLNPSLWYNVSAVFNRSGTSVLLYLNGVFQSSVTIPSQSAMQNAAPGIVRSACCAIYTGKLSSFMAYNAVLSQSEILQNYNALKSRFNLT
jgi:hypothetical protein